MVQHVQQTRLLSFCRLSAQVALRAAQACCITRSTASSYLAFQLGVVGVCLVIVGYVNQFVLVVVSLQAVPKF